MALDLATHRRALEAMLNERSFRIEHRRDFISGFDWRVILTGPSVGGYGDMDDRECGKFYHAEHARKAGEIFVETGLLPAFQTDERIAAARVDRINGRVDRRVVA